MYFTDRVTSQLNSASPQAQTAKAVLLHSRVGTLQRLVSATQHGKRTATRQNKGDNF
jgi:hypothetical protein